MVLALLSVAAVGIIAADEADAVPYTSITGDTHILKAGADGEFTIVYTDPALVSEDDVEISYTAKLVDGKGNTQSSAVSPSSGSLDNGAGKVLTVTAPRNAGDFTLEVEYSCTVGVDEPTTTTETYDIKVVNPIVLTQTLKINEGSKVDPSGLGVFFYVDGKRIDDSYTTFTVNAQGTATVSYDWVASPAEGKHTFKVLPAGGEEISIITGLGEEHTFYVGEESYTTIIVLAVVLVVLMIVLMIWIYRKPVKNFGKPKSRR